MTIVLNEQKIWKKLSKRTNKCNKIQDEWKYKKNKWRKKSILHNDTNSGDHYENDNDDNY